MNEQSANQVDQSVDVPRYRAAFLQLAEERSTLLKEQVLQVNVEVPATVIAVQTSLPGIRAMRPVLQRSCPSSI